MQDCMDFQCMVKKFFAKIFFFKFFFFFFFFFFRFFFIDFYLIHSGHYDPNLSDDHFLVIQILRKQISIPVAIIVNHQGMGLSPHHFLADYLTRSVFNPFPIRSEGQIMPPHKDMCPTICFTLRLPCPYYSVNMLSFEFCSRFDTLYSVIVLSPVICFYILSKAIFKEH